MKAPTPHNEKQRTTIATFSVWLIGVPNLSSGFIEMLLQTPQISKAINAGVVSIAPARLQSITADEIESDKLEAPLGVAHVWTRNITEDIGLAAACRAWACAPQHLDLQKRFGGVAPSDGQLVSDLLDISWLKSHLSRRTVHLVTN